MPVRRLGCFSAGGMPGLDLHAGMCLAAQECGITFDVVTGASAGSAIAASWATGRSARSLVEFLQGLTDRDIRDERNCWALRALLAEQFGLGDIQSVMAAGKVEAKLARLLPTEFRNLAIPCGVAVTDEFMGRSAMVTHGDLRKTVLASMAIPGFFPPVVLQDLRAVCSDGGAMNYLGLPPDWRAFDEVWVFIASPPYKYIPRRQTVFYRAQMGVHFALLAQIERQLEMLKSVPRLACTNCEFHPRIVVIRPTCGAAAGMLRFDHDLIHQACAEARVQIVEQYVEAQEHKAETQKRGEA